MTNQNNHTKHSGNGHLPEGWEVKSLGEITLVKGEYGINAPAVEFSEELPTYLRITDIDEDGNFISSEKKSVADESFEKYLLEEGDIVFARTGATVGKTYLHNHKNGSLVYAGFLIKFKPDKKKVIPYYIKSYTTIKNYWDWVKKVSMRSGQPGINSQEYCSFKLPLPPLPEQKAIAACLSTWDKAIELLKKKTEKAELRKKWLMQQLLTGKLRLRSATGERFKGEWKVINLGKVFNEIKNINDGSNGHTVMTISSKLGLVSQEDKFDKIIAGESLKKYTQLSKGDFAYNKGNSKRYPMGCIFQLEKTSALVPFVYICFSPTDLVNSTFYKQWFIAHGLDRQLKKIITSGARGDGLLNVNTNDFFKLKIVYPDKKEQTAIAKVLQSADNEVQLLKSKLNRLKEQKKGLMQVLLTGKKRLNY